MFCSTGLFCTAAIACPTSLSCVALVMFTDTIKVAIIGAAGRRGDAHRLTAAHFTSMVNTARCIVRQVLGLSPSQVHLVSGGSSYADHVAVVLYVQSVMEQAQEEGTASDTEAYAGLTLHLPASFHASSTSAPSMSADTPLSSVHPPAKSNAATTQRFLHACGCAASVSYAHPHFHDNGESSWKTNPGRVLNRYHSQFSSVMNRGAAVAAISAAPHTQPATGASNRDLPNLPSSHTSTHPSPSSLTASKPRPVPTPTLSRSRTTFSSFHDLYTALALGAELRDVDDPIIAQPAGSHRISAQRREAGDAFHRRNSLVAQSQHLIAFTFGGMLSIPFTSDTSAGTLSTLLSSPCNQPCPGGTADTWNKCRGNRLHVPLDHLFSPQLTRCLQWSATASIPPMEHQPVSSIASNDCAARQVRVSPAPPAPHLKVSGTHVAEKQQQQQQRRAKRRYHSVGEQAGATISPKRMLLTCWLQRVDCAGRSSIASSGVRLAAESVLSELPNKAKAGPAFGCPVSSL